MRSKFVSSPMPTQTVAPHSQRYYDEDLFADRVGAVEWRIFHDYSSGAHAHGFIELNVVTRGAGRHYLDGYWREARSGDVFVIPPHSPHAYQSGGELDVFHLLIRRRLLANHALDLMAVPGYLPLFTRAPQFHHSTPERHSVRLPPARFDEVERMLDLIRSELDLLPAPNHLGAQALAIYLITKLCHLHNLQNPVKMPQLSAASQPIQRALARMRKDYDRRLTLDDLSATAGLHRDSFGRLFRAIVGQTPMEHLNEVRLCVARDLLLTTDRPISQIALDTGFYDSAHFTRSFSAALGLTPTQFRAGAGQAPTGG